MSSCDRCGIEYVRKTICLCKGCNDYLEVSLKYDKLQAKLNLQAAAIKRILAEVKINTDKDFYEHVNGKVIEMLKGSK